MGFIGYFSVRPADGPLHPFALGITRSQGLW